MRDRVRAQKCIGIELYKNQSRSSYYNGQTRPDTQPPYADTLQKHTAEWVGEFLRVTMIHAPAVTTQALGAQPQCRTASQF